MLKYLTSYCKDYLKAKFNTYTQINNIKSSTIHIINTKLLRNKQLVLELKFIKVIK